MKLRFLALFIVTGLSHLSFAGDVVNCGPKPTEPISYCNSSPALPADQLADCKYSHELSIKYYEFELWQWNLCEGANSSEAPPSSGYWRKKNVTMCTTGQIPIYGGSYFAGERRSETYVPGEYGWYCDEVYVPETKSQYYYYPDYDGTNCEVYLDQPTRIEVGEICQTKEINVFIEY